MTETPSGDHRGAEQRSGDGADAEAGVEPRQDRAAEALLDERALDVHGHVPGAVAEAEQEEADDDRDDSHSIAEGRGREPDAAEDRHGGDRARGAEPCDDRPRQRQGDQRARRDRSSSRPSSPGLSFRPSRTCGMRDAQLANAKPAPKKT